ncbi:zinc-binding dehydrogenase [Dietzia sp.]|uniref:zinc-binding dehydrogenase n=1 Tax=Dietzia sp. TaxID=1871616 RepID=UPI002FDAC83F
MRIFGFERYGGPEVAGFLDVPEPELRPGTVLVETVSVGLNPVDINVRSGARQSGFPVEFPMAMGREAAGIVLASRRSPESEEFARRRLPSGAPVPPAIGEGTLVFGSCAAGVGALGERTLLEESSVATVMSGLAPDRAACIPVAVGTAYDAIGELAPHPGEVVLVLGAGGGVGIHAGQFAAIAGARVIGVASPEKREFVEHRGIEHVSSGPGWLGHVRDALGDGGRGGGRIAAVVDCVGGETLRGAADLLKRDEDGARRIRSLADKETAVELGGSGVRRRRESGVFAAIAALARQRDIKISLSRVVDFADTAAAYETVAGGHAAGKVVVRLQEER